MSSTTALEKQNHMQYGFAVFVASVGFVTCAMLPPFTFLLLASSAASLLLYRQQWSTITEQHPSLDLDKTSLTLISAAILIGGFLFLPLDLLSKMLICALAGGGIGYFFANQCVLPSQTKLNESLIEAAKSSNIDEVNRLLKLGADPFAPDVLGNCAIHHSIQNHANAALVLTALHQRGQKTDHDFNHVLSHAKKLFTDENIRKQWSAWGKSLKTCFNQNNAENRVLVSEACVHIFEAYVPVLKHCLKKLTGYLRQQVSYPKNMNCTNLRGATALDILNTVTIDQNIKKTLNEMLAKFGIQKGNSSTVSASDTPAQTATAPLPAPQQPLKPSTKEKLKPK